MTAAKVVVEDLKMNATSFDRIMAKALGVKPEAESKAKGRSKTKKAPKKKRAGK